MVYSFDWRWGSYDYLYQLLRPTFLCCFPTSFAFHVGGVGYAISPPAQFVCCKHLTRELRYSTNLNHRCLLERKGKLEFVHEFDDAQHRNRKCLKNTRPIKKILWNRYTTARHIVTVKIGEKLLCYQSPYLCII
jgi:hypothetical protein